MLIFFEGSRRNRTNILSWQAAASEVMDRPARDAIIYQWSRVSALLSLLVLSGLFAPCLFERGTLWRWTARENISARPSADQWRCVYLPMGTMVTPYNGYLTACWPIASRRSLKLVDQWWDTLPMWGHAMYPQRPNGSLCPALVQT